MAHIQRVDLDEVLLHFSELEDPRSAINRQHPLVRLMVIAVIAILAGASRPTVIASWAALRVEFLLNTLNLPNGTPCKSIFRRALMARYPGAFQA